MEKNEIDNESVRQIKATIIACALAQTLESDTQGTQAKKEDSFFMSLDYAFRQVYGDYAHFLDR